MDDPVVAFGIDILEGEILQLLLDRVYTEAVGQGSIDIQRFPGDGNAAVLRLEAEGTHIVKTVGQLDEHDADIPGHGKDHLPERLGLSLLPVGKIQLIQLGDAIDQIGDFIAELCTDRIEGDSFAVLDRIVQQAGSNGRRVDHQLGEDGGDNTGMSEIRLTGFAELAGMGIGCKLPGLFHKQIAVAGMVFLDTVEHLIQGHCLVGCESHIAPPFGRVQSGEWRVKSLEQRVNGRDLGFDGGTATEVVDGRAVEQVKG